ncbi:carnosine N-methyltransferase [Aureococcus anophagefferens]|nr:carnosine N-methyltransferase [Aureococcus anophagefferens]
MDRRRSAPPPPPPSREEEDALNDEEQFHFQRVVGSFRGYERVACADAERTRRASERLHPKLERLLPPRSLERRVAGLRAAAAANGSFLAAARPAARAAARPRPARRSWRTRAPSARLRPRAATPPRAPPPPRTRAGRRRGARRAADFSKVRSTLHSCARDWSDEGAAERAACYGPLVDELRARLPVDDGNRNRQRILVPGAGLARLVLEVAAAGYGAQGNEFSYHMLLVSNFILNSHLDPRSVALYPYVDQPSNVKQSGDRLRAVRIPDVSPDALLHGAPPCDAPVDFSMAAGEFLEVYRGQDGEWAGVLSCFFVDTAPVALEYVDAIFDLLEPGGYWINLGPLLYHWVPSSSADLEGAGMDDRYAQSIELSWEELKHAIEARGFELLNEEWRHCTYTANARSMMNTDYECIFFTARKPLT